LILHKLEIRRKKRPRCVSREGEGGKGL
jgi:hypothetical protein